MEKVCKLIELVLENQQGKQEQEVDETYQLVRWCLDQKSAGSFHLLMVLNKQDTQFVDVKTLAMMSLPKVSSVIGKLLVDTSHSKTER